MYTLFIANKNYSSWSLRPWILMKECGIAFEEKQVMFSSEDEFERYRAFSPNGKVPCLHTNGFIVWDSLAIIEFLAEHHRGVWPENAAARTWGRCVSAEMHSGFRNVLTVCSMNCAVLFRLKAITPALRREIARLEEILAEGLSKFGGPFLAGEKFTAVDAVFSPVILRHLSYELFSLPEVIDYCIRIRSRIHMQQWVNDGIHEPVDQLHEDDCKKFAVVVSDVRDKGSVESHQSELN